MLRLRATAHRVCVNVVTCVASAKAQSKNPLTGVFTLYAGVLSEVAVVAGNLDFKGAPQYGGRFSQGFTHNAICKHHEIKPYKHGNWL